MHLADRLRVELMRASAPFTVSYGDNLRFAGRDLPAPKRVRIRTRHGKVRVMLYRPAPGPLPVHVHLHGGAFLMRYPAMDDWWCRYVAATAGVVVANVDFEVAPRVAYPVAQHQAHDVAAALAADGTPVSVGGFSSGGGLAASVALQARDSGSFVPTLQVLGIPALDLSAEPRDDDPGMISPELRRLVRRVYLPDPASRLEPYASPLLADGPHGAAAGHRADGRARRAARRGRRVRPPPARGRGPGGPRRHAGRRPLLPHRGPGAGPRDDGDGRRRDPRRRLTLARA